MKSQNSKPARKSRFLYFFMAAVVAVLALAAQSHYANRYPSWREEVRLSDGRVITIHQKREFYKNYGTNQSWVEIDLPEIGGKKVWHSYLMPQRIDVVNGSTYAFGVPRGIRQNEFYKYPKNFIVAFKWNGKEFARIPFAELPEITRKEENVYSCIPSPKVDLLTIDEKDRNWCPIIGDRWKFGKEIDISNYRSLADYYAKLGGGKPISD